MIGEQKRHKMLWIQFLRKKKCKDGVLYIIISAQQIFAHTINYVQIESSLNFLSGCDSGTILFWIE